jgi:predicted extracellular nuclease
MIYKIAFYNTENLFDTLDDPETADHDFLPKGELKWNELKYKHKIVNISQVINEIDVDNNLAIIGLSEVENEEVVKDLINQLNNQWEYVYCKTSDVRGIDQVLLFQPNFITILKSQVFSMGQENTSQFFLRELLFVELLLDNEIFQLFLVHWPSRKKGKESTEEKRLNAAIETLQIIENINLQSPLTNLILLGDLNDNPDDDSVSLLCQKTPFNNPFFELMDKNIGTCKHEGQWYIFDQILYSPSIISSKKWSLSKGGIFNPEWLYYNENTNAGPFRTYLGNVYMGGYSDHFPIYIELQKN